MGKHSGKFRVNGLLRLWLHLVAGVSFRPPVPAGLAAAVSRAAAAGVGAAGWPAAGAPYQHGGYYM